MSHDPYTRNVEALQRVNPRLAMMLENQVPDEQSDYEGFKVAKDGTIVPLLSGSIPAHSLRDPMREAQRLVESVPFDSFILFCGLAGGYHIRQFLETHPRSYCAVGERNERSLKELLRLVDVSDIISHPRVTITLLGNDGYLTETLLASYIPAFHGNFNLQCLRSWKDHVRVPTLESTISGLIRDVSRDYSVQAHFGKLWMGNILRNLVLGGSITPQVIDIDTRKTAVVTAAGPSLEAELAPLRRERDSVVIFATDTSRGVLEGFGIVPDFFVSVDPQQASSYHAYRRFSPKTTVIMDLAGNPVLAERARSDHSPLIFVSAGHPLTEYASRFSYMPSIDASSGTVALAAKSCALSLGFSDVRLLGADFKFTGGKSYARGTYLSDLFDGSSMRLNPSESRYAGLIFRTAVTRQVMGCRIDYHSETLDRYAERASKQVGHRRWSLPLPGTFPSDAFLGQYSARLVSLLTDPSSDMGTLATVLPLVAWFRRKETEGQNSVEASIRLALALIARYTYKP